MSAKKKLEASQYRPLLVAWRENKGNWLLATAGIVCILACIIGYFDLIPDIRASTNSGFATPVLGGKTLEVRITGCQSDQGQVVAMLYDGHNFTKDSIPMRIKDVLIF